MGTVTRRAVEKTWLTASNAKEKLVGSELKAMVSAPADWCFVGADVDSQELWIGSLLGDAQFGWSGATALGWMTLQGTKSDGTDLHSRTANILGTNRDNAKIFNYGRIYGAGVKYAAQLLLKFNPALSPSEADALAGRLYHATKGKRHYYRDSHNEADAINSYSGDNVGNRRRDALRDQNAFVSYAGGTESFMFNQMEGIAKAPTSRTPVLSAEISDALLATHVDDNFITSRVNWVVQSSGVDYLHMLLVAVAFLFKHYSIPGRVALTIHDEVRFLVRETEKYRAALALQIANLWTRAAFVQALGVQDLPLSVAFFSAVDFDNVLRKEVHLPCITPSNKLPIPPGEALDIYKILQNCPSLVDKTKFKPPTDKLKISGKFMYNYFLNDSNSAFKSTSTVGNGKSMSLYEEKSYLALLKKQLEKKSKSSVNSKTSSGYENPKSNATDSPKSSPFESSKSSPCDTSKSNFCDTSKTNSCEDPKANTKKPSQTVKARLESKPARVQRNTETLNVWSSLVRNQILVSAK
jgi:DNA polymerase gamma 1